MAAAPQASVDARRVLTHACVLAALAIAFGDIAPAHAQTYPTKTIKLVVPFGPGGPTDVAARVVAQVVPSGLGQSVVIENRPGAGGALGRSRWPAPSPTATRC